MMTDKGNTVPAVTDRPNVASSSSDTGRTWLSDEHTEPVVGRGRDDQSPDSVWSWQTVVVTTSSIAVLLLVAVVAAVAAWKLCHSATGSHRNKITFKRTQSLSNAACFKYVKYLTTNTIILVLLCTSLLCIKHTYYIHCGLSKNWQ